ncbi:MAG: outer membrane lipoprotein carrier protein LolA [Ferruginibacter sp.]
MKRFISFIFSLSLFITVVNAQVPKGMGNSDPDAKKVLDAVSAKFKTYKYVTAKFNLKIENSGGKSIGSKTGTVQMKGSKYHVVLTDQEIFCDGNSVWTYDKAAKEVTITKVDPNGNSMTPQKIFTNFYDKDFLYKLNGESKSGTKVIQEIELTPIDKSKAFHKVYLYIDKAAQTITTTKVLENTGNKYTYGVSSINTTAVVPDASFVFDTKKFPGAEVNDLR